MLYLVKLFMLIFNCIYLDIELRIYYGSYKFILAWIIGVINLFAAIRTDLV